MSKIAFIYPGQGAQKLGCVPLDAIDAVHVVANHSVQISLGQLCCLLESPDP